MGFPPICAFVHAAYSEGMKPFLALFGRALVTLLLLAPQLSAQAVPAEAVGAGVRPSGGERAPIRVGVSGPFSGPSAPMGLSMREGIRIAAAELNAAGGLLGRRIELVERDDEASNELGAQIVRDFIHRDRVTAGLGIVNTGVALASQRHYQMARIPVITSVATGSLITKQFQPPEFAENYVFRVSASDTLQAAVIVEEAVGQRGLTRLAILHDATNYGVLGSQDLVTTLRARGLEGAPSTVALQYPEAGTGSRKGVTVDVVMVDQAEAPAFLMPDLKGRTLSAARSAVDETGCILAPLRHVRDARTPPQTVLRQKPEPGTRILRGEIVELVVATR